MNALCYKIVFSKRLGTLVAVGEHTVGQGKTASGSGVRSVVNGAISSFIGALSAAFAAVALTFLTASVTASVGFAAAPAANALPSGASVNSGSVAINSTSSSNAAVMNITQTTDKASVNWQSFNIGSAARVNVQQNSASSVLLNRVVGNDPSQIFGKLSANGQIVLVNPNGIVFGSGGSVTASAFTASAFGINEQDFASGKYKYTRNGSTSGVTVQDGATLNATAPGGYIALIGASVDNQGRISTKQGAVVLAAGESITLPAGLTNNISVPLSGKVRLELLPSTINAMVANSGTITTEGGQVLMQAAALSDAVASITHTGTIDTTGAQGGAVTLLADGGVIKATGSITANSSGNDERGQQRKGADIIIGRDEETGVLARDTDVSGATIESKGGFVETSGDYLATDGVLVKAAEWLLDPSDIIISNGASTNVTVTGTSPIDLVPTNPGSSNVQVSTIQTAINAGTNVTIKTTNSSSINNSGEGNITIANALLFANDSNTDATLSLIADNGIIQNAGATITTNAVTGKRGLVNISMEAKGNYQGNTASNALSKGITLKAAITTNGDVILKSTTNNSGSASASNAIGVDIESTAAINAKNISITGKSESSFGIQSKGTLTATDKITLDGTSKNWVGVVTNGAMSAGGALSITGTKTTAAGYQGANIASNLTGNSIYIKGTAPGWDAVQFGNNVQVKSTTTLEVVGNSTSAKGIYFLGNGVTIDAESYSMKGTSGTCNAIQFASSSGTTLKSTSTTTLSFIEGTKTTAGGDTIFNAGTLTINSGPGKATLQTSTTNVGGGIRINGGSTVNTTGDVTIGSLNTSNAYTKNEGTISAVGKLKLLGNSSTANGIITTGTITSTGLVSMEGRAVGTNAGVRVGANVTGGSVDIYGSSTGGVGVDVAAIVKSTDTPATSPGVTLTGFGGNTGGGINNQGVWVRSTGSVDSASKVSIVGTNSVYVNSSTLMGTLIQGQVTAAGDIELEGHSTGGSSSHGLVINNTVTSTGGNITATASNATSEKVRLSISGAGALIASGSNKNITMVANTMDFSGATAINANGTVNITAKDATTAIRIGVDDGFPIAPRLSLNQTELNKITAAKTVIGDSNNTGGITVSGAVTTLEKTGNITLLTQGNIAVNATLTVGVDSTGATTKNLTLNGAAAGSNSSAISQTAAIKAAGLELLGTNATHTLTNAGNDIKKLAGDTKTVSLTNNQAFAIDTVNKVGLTTSGNTTLNSTEAVTQTAAIKSAGLELLGTGGSYTLNNSGNTVQKLAGNTGAVSLTNQGNLTVGVVNGTTGLTATNDIKLTTTTATGTALSIKEKIESTGNVEINATTSETFVPLLGRFAAVESSKLVKGKDITMNAVALGTTGKTLGYRGAGVGGKFEASNNLTLKASTKNTGSGFYMYDGALSAGNTLSIEGTSAQGQGVGFDGPGSPTNVSITSAKGITIKGNASTAGQAAINLRDVNLTNNISGAVTLEAIKGDITTSGTGTLTQSGNGGVKLTTVDAGNITVPKIINRGTGDVVIAAGSNLAVGDGTGGQVKINADSKVTQSNTTNPGNTYLYTGNANDTGSLSAVGGFANGFFLSTIGTDTVNAASNTEYKTSGTQNTIAGGAKTQVMFREKVALTGAFNNATLTYGDSTNSTAVKAALQATNPASGSSNIISTTSNAGTFKILNADFFADMASGKPSVDTALSLATNKSTSGNLKANSAGYNVDIAGTKYTLNTTAKLVVNQKSLTALYAANDKVFDGNTNATVTGSLQNTITGDLVSPTNTNATFDTSAVGTNKLVRITGISLAGFDAENYKIDLVANPTFTAIATAAITPIAPKPPAPVVPTGTTSGGVKIPLSAANPFQLASAEDLGGEDFCKNTSIDPLNESSTANSNSSCACEDSKLTQDAQICFEKDTQKISAQ